MTLRLIKNPVVGIVLALAVIAASALSLAMPRQADATQSEFCGPMQLNSNGTTTPTYITTGAATSTLASDNCSARDRAIDSAFLTWQVISSTTPPSLSVRVEVSRDGIDWYPYPFQGTVGTTTTMGTGPVDYVWPAMASTTGDLAGNGVASSTAGTAVNLRGARFHGSLQIPGTPYPYIRTKFAVPVGAPPIGLTAEMTVKRQK